MSRRAHVSHTKHGIFSGLRSINDSGLEFKVCSAIRVQHTYTFTVIMYASCVLIFLDVLVPEQEPLIKRSNSTYC